MTAPPSPEPALARWLARGTTSLTHPVLRHVMETLFHPLGIEAEWLEAEPLSALESGSGEWWLRNPRWNPERPDRSHRGADDSGPLTVPPGRFPVTVDSRGILSIGAGDPRAAGTLSGGGDDWTAITRHSAEAAQQAESFIYAAIALILAGDPAADLFARGDDRAFCAAVQARLENQCAAQAATPAAPRARENTRAGRPETGRAGAGSPE